MKSFRPAPPKPIYFDFKNFYRPRLNIRRLLYILSFVFILAPSLAGAAQINLAWQKSSGSNIAGYKMHYGDYSGNYRWTVDVGNSTSCTIGGLNKDKTYYFAATAYNTKQEESDYSNEVSYKASNNPPLPPTFRWKFGKLQIDHNWTHVRFSKPYTDPIVIAKSFSLNGGAPGVIRIRNVNGSGFDIRLQEWSYLDGSHAREEVSYLVMERGNHILGGARVEAGRLTTNNTNTFRRFNYNQSFNRKPVVISSIVSYNGGSPVTGRMRNITTNGFDFCMQEEQAGNQRHSTEAIHYIAWEPLTGTDQNRIFDIGTTGNIVRHGFHRIGFSPSFSNDPFFLADMQTTDGWDIANVRWRNKNANSVEVQIDEEQSLDSETTHTHEVVGYITFSLTN